MKYSVTYGGKPKLIKDQKDVPGHKGYDLKDYYRASDGSPVILLCSKDNGIWKVCHGFSEIVFGSEDEAADYCKERFHATRD